MRTQIVYEQLLRDVSGDVDARAPEFDAVRAEPELQIALPGARAHGLLRCFVKGCVLGSQHACLVVGVVRVPDEDRVRAHVVDDLGGATRFELSRELDVERESDCAVDVLGGCCVIDLA